MGWFIYRVELLYWSVAVSDQLTNISYGWYLFILTYLPYFLTNWYKTWYIGIWLMCKYFLYDNMSIKFAQTCQICLCKHVNHLCANMSIIFAQNCQLVWTIFLIMFVQTWQSQLIYNYFNQAGITPEMCSLFSKKYLVHWWKTTYYNWHLWPSWILVPGVKSSSVTKSLLFGPVYPIRVITFLSLWFWSSAMA